MRSRALFEAILSGAPELYSRKGADAIAAPSQLRFYLSPRTSTGALSSQAWNGRLTAREKLDFFLSPGDMRGKKTAAPQTTFSLPPSERTCCAESPPVHYKGNLTEVSEQRGWKTKAELV